MLYLYAQIQCCLLAEFIRWSYANNFWSVSVIFLGFGGQVDFIYGTSVADDGAGKPIIAIPSVTAKGQSRIVPVLKEVGYFFAVHRLLQITSKAQRTTRKTKTKIDILQGAGVVTTRGHVRYVVTEYGIAQLWGKTVRQRAYELIQIAHPDHRERLEKAAFERLKCMPSKN